MTKQFKFGDLVIVDNRSPKPETGVIVWVNNELGEAKVCFEHKKRSEYRPIKYFELVPNPDTVRLDWLADKNNNMGSVLLPTALVEKHLDSLRDAIDAAMQLYKVKDENNAKI